MFWDLFKKKQPVAEQVVGEVVHFFDRLNVAVIRLSANLQIGDKIKVKRGEEVFTDIVTSIQVDHAAVEKGGKGDEVAILLTKATKAGALVYRV